MKHAFAVWFGLMFGPTVLSAAESLHVLCYHDVRDNVRGYLDPDQYAVATETLVAHLDWLTAAGYHFVRLDDVLAAREGARKLPDKAVLLTFDDTYTSFYTRIFPILQLYEAPALYALVTEWIEAAPGTRIDYGSGPEAPREGFITWDQAREMQASGLIEFASHSDRLHRSVRCNPQDSLAPSVVTRRFLPETGSYESLEAWRDRIKLDLRNSSKILSERLGRQPRAMIWPYGETNAIATDAARAAGFVIDFTLGEPKGVLPQSGSVERFLMAANAPLDDLADQLRTPMADPALRIVEIRIEDWFLKNATEFEKRLDTLIEYVKFVGPNQILLDVFARDSRSGKISGAYFPESGFPMIADVANRLVQLLNRKVPAAVVVRLPAETQHLLPLTETLCQYLPLQGLALASTLPNPDAEAVMQAARRWRPAAKRFDAAVGERLPPPSPRHCLVNPKQADPSRADTSIPFVELSAAPETAVRILQDWLRAGGRHAAAGPLTPTAGLAYLQSLRGVLSANTNPYRESLIRQLRNPDPQ